MYFIALRHQSINNFSLFATENMLEVKNIKGVLLLNPRLQ